MPPESKKVEYKQVQFEERVPFVIYADFESLLQPTERAEQHRDDDGNSGDHDDDDDERPTVPKDTEEQ